MVLHSSIKFAIATILTAVFAVPALANIEIFDIRYHQSFKSDIFDDSTDNDVGGTMFVFVRNNDTQPRILTNVTLNGTAMDTHVSNGTLQFWRYWPDVIQPGQITCITAKAGDSPLAPGDSVTVGVTSSSGASDSDTATLRHPLIRIGSIIPSQDMKTVYIYMVNRDTVDYTVNEVWMNEDVTSQCTFVGSATVGPEEVSIIKVSYSEPIEPMEFFMVRVRAEKSGAGNWWVACPYRMLPASIPLGTWSSSTGGDLDRQEYLRTQFRNANTGVDDFSEIYEMYYNNYIKANTSNVNAGNLAANIGNPAILSWFLGDEKDNSDTELLAVVAENQLCWNTDPTHPTYHNLVKNNRFSKWGMVTDVVGMDHYVQYAPNILGFNSGDFDEIHEYMRILKLAVEPKVMWVWPQLASGVWSDQPDPWGVNYQFWAQVMHGGKGFFWFDMEPTNEDDYPDIYAEAFDIAQQFEQVRGLVNYSEAADIVTVNSGDIVTRCLVSEDAIVVIVLNDNIDYGLFYSSYDIDPTSGSITVPVPSWIPVEQVKRIEPSGPVNQAFSQAGQNVTINYSINEQSLVYIIGRNDTQPPEKPKGLHISRQPASGVVLSWDDAFDNYGVKSYRVFKNGSVLATVQKPTYEDSTGGTNDLYQVEAIDAAGNLSGPCRPYGLNFLYLAFEQDNDWEGLLFDNNILNLETKEGIMQMDLRGKAWIYSHPLELDAAGYPYLRVGLVNQTSDTICRFGWITNLDPNWDVQKSNRINTVANSPDLQEFVVDLSDKEPLWQDTITQVRFVVAQNATSGSVGISYLILQGQDPSVPGDADSSGAVNYMDYSRLAENFLQVDQYPLWTGGNVNGDYVTDVRDAEIIAGGWLN